MVFQHDMCRDEVLVESCAFCTTRLTTDGGLHAILVQSPGPSLLPPSHPFCNPFRPLTIAMATKRIVRRTQADGIVMAFCIDLRKAPDNLH